MNLRNTEMNSNRSHAPVIMERVDIDALVERCLNLLKHSSAGDHDASNCRSFNCYKQVFVGIAGTPGSGKSYIAKQVRDAINQQNPNGDPASAECVVIPMDGYHLTRQQLKEMANRGDKVKSDQFSDGELEKQLNYEQLMARRGASFTYCPSRFIADLRKCKEKGGGSVPMYDREKHDPISNSVHVTKSNKIVLIEGLYLLCLDDEDWKPLDELWDDKWYVAVYEEETKRRLIDRHLETWNERKTQQWGGNDREAAARKAEANDLKNARCIETNSKHNANLIVNNEKVHHK